MKKVFLSITNLTGGGAERVVSVWASELAELGYGVSVLVSGRTENEYPLSPKVRVRAICENYEDYKKLSFWKKLKKRRKILKTERPDYLISFLPHTQFLSLICSFGLGIRRIETVRNSPWHIGANQNFTRKLIWKLSFKTGYKTILQSSDQAPYFSRRVQKKCVVIPNPISPLYIENDKREVAEQVTRFIAAGRICAQKNYPMMIDGFAKAIEAHHGDAKYEHARLYIFGGEDGGSLAFLREKIREKGLEDRVFFMGRTNRLQEEYLQSDVFLMTSDFEGMPNALAEAMASRLVCVATDCKTGPRDLITHGENGFLIPVGDSDALKGAIETVMAMTKEEREAMTSAAREKVLRYCSKENSIQRLCELLR